MSFDPTRGYFNGVDNEPRQKPATKPADDAPTFLDRVREIVWDKCDHADYKRCDCGSDQG